MAVSKNLYTRGLKQRLAGAVWYQRKGETVVRELAPAVSNPQTDKQMQQRAMLANLVGMYRANQFWLNFGSFESKKTSWSDYNAFVSANSKVKPVFLTQGMVSNGAAIVLPYIVAKGSLPSVSVFEYEPNNTFGTDIYAEGIDIDSTGSQTVAALSEALLSSNNGLQVGDQLSVIINYQGVSEAGDPYVTARAYEFIIDTSDGRTIASLGLAGILLTDTLEGGLNALVIAVDSDTAQVGVTMVISRTSGASLKVSTQTLVLSEAQQEFVLRYQTDTAYQRYVESYGSTGSQNFLSAGYSSKRSTPAPLQKDISNISVEDVGSFNVGQGPVQGNTSPLDVEIYFTEELTESDEIGNDSRVTYTVVYEEPATGALGRSTQTATATKQNGRLIFQMASTNTPYQLESLGVTLNGRSLAASFRITMSGAIED